MKKKTIATLLSVAMVATLLSGCKSNKVSAPADPTDAPTQSVDKGGNDEQKPTQAPAQLDDMSKQVSLKFNYAAGNKSRTMTYNQGTPLTLSDGTQVSAGMLKPMWSYVASQTNSVFTDVTVQDQKATEMMDTESTTNFEGANIFGGNSISAKFMYYGPEGKFVNLSEWMEKGAMPNFKAYLDANPTIKAAITAYDGNIYHVPYIAEVGNFARCLIVRESWVTGLLDKTDAAFDSSDFSTYYEGYYVKGNERTGDNGGTVTPKDGINITKKTNQNIIDIQNNLPVKNGKTLTEALVQYIKDNYDYTTPSELYLGEKAAYDMDELVALFRCIKANPSYLTEGKADAVWPLFSRKSSYREDLLRMAEYWGGQRVNGSDSYASRWYIDKDGSLQYSYDDEGIYSALSFLSQMEAEGLIYSDCYDLTDKTDFRKTLWGTDASEAPSYGFAVFDWIASSTADALNKDTKVILPPVAKINGVWQYYIDNSRVIKPDGWAISVGGSSEEQVIRALTVFDYFFTEEGHIAQNYGLPMDLELGGYKGPDGNTYPKFSSWVLDTCNEVAKGDVSSFLRDWIGALMPVGFQKEIGFEYQYTSERGFEGWALLQNSTTNLTTYAGEGIKGDNPNYYTLVPPVFSLTSREQETVNSETSIEQDEIVETMFNVVRYKTKGNAPEGTLVLSTYDDYKAFFQEKGVDKYQEVYQTAFKRMAAQ